MPGGPCQPELFLEAVFANFVLIVSLSKLWLPGLREGESRRNPPSWFSFSSSESPHRWLGLVGDPIQVTQLWFAGTGNMGVEEGGET